MENVRHYVEDSGNSTIRGFFSSDAADFDLPGPSLRHNITRANAKSIYDLADGATGDDEENEIRDRMVFSHNSYELIRMMQVIGNWAGLDDELPEGHLDQIAPQIEQVLDQRDYTVYQMVRRYLSLLEYKGTPNLGDCFARLLRWPAEFQPAEIDSILLPTARAELLKRITSATMRDRTSMVAAALVIDDVINAYTPGTTHRANEVKALMHEANYTTLICGSLRNLDFKPLYRIVAQMVDPAINDDLKRRACRDTCVRLAWEFAAAAKAVETMGTNENKTTVNRFMQTMKAATDNFPATLPAPSAVGAIVTAIGGVGDQFTDLQTAITNLPDIANAISIPDLLNSADDDKARQLITELNAQLWLPRLAFTIKVKLVNALLAGSTDDDDENAINLVLQTAQAYDQAELYQLTAAAGWDSLYSSMNGDEYDTMEGTLDNLS